ncbi:hypothetical protein GCM10009639_24330 [Kitasatospora putterlickiae]|uniref:Uncharacterized protein n=1 Tax=Kitasatospora putterlickiae TaxID=221725 RepID=A0ABN1XZZ5_9ACTN
MDVSESALYERAADCYLAAGMPAEAARCLRAAGAYRRSAELWGELGLWSEAVTDFRSGQLVHQAAWTLVHELGDPREARRLIRMVRPGELEAHEARSAMVDDDYYPFAPDRFTVRDRLVLARCDAAEGTGPDSLPPVLRAAANHLQDRRQVFDRLVEDWAVTLAEQHRRYDQVALIYAASLRGRRRNAATRWRDWASRVLHAELTLPPVEPDRVRPVSGPVLDGARGRR